MEILISTNKPRTPRLFDIKHESERIHDCLSELKGNSPPGQQFMKGSKTQVLIQLKNELKSLFDEGYTTQQIAQAISKSGFSILPKTITQILNGKPKVAKTKSKTTSKKNDEATVVKTVIKRDTKMESPGQPAGQLAGQPVPNLKGSRPSIYEDVE